MYLWLHQRFELVFTQDTVSAVLYSMKQMHIESLKIWVQYLIPTINFTDHANEKLNEDYKDYNMMGLKSITLVISYV